MGGWCRLVLLRAVPQGPHCEDASGPYLLCTAAPRGWVLLRFRVCPPSLRTVPVCHAGTSQNGASSPARSRMSPERADAHWSLCVLICLALSSPGPISPSHCVSVIHGCSSGGSHMASSPLQLHSDFSQVFFLWPFMPLDKRQWPSEWFGLWQGNVLCGSQCLCIQDAVCGQDF